MLRKISINLEPRITSANVSAQSNDTQRHLKDLQYINQSLRTVATQLLNVTTSDEAKTKESSSRKPEKKTDIPATEISSNAGQSVSVGFGRPINSKFGFFESGHPGQAMALTEEELEREMSSTRLMTAYKNHPTTTTTGGISTWILLNPPSTTGQPMVEEKKQTTVEIHQEIRLPIKTTPFERVETKTERIDKPTQLTTTPITRKPTLTTPKKPTTSTRPERTTENLEKLETFSSSSDTEATRRETISTIVSTSPATPTTLKKVQIVRTTAKLKSTTPKTTVFFKNLTTTTTRKPVQQPRPKPTASRKTTTAMTTTKQELKTDVNSTAKIEKVTFRPIQMITTTKNKLGNSERPMFVTKIKASILTDGQRTTPIPSSSGSTVNVSGISNLSDLIEIPVRSKPIGTKVNNVLKVQLKKPLEDSTKIEIEPIKVSAPVLKIEKVDKDNSDKIDFDKHVDALVSQSKISNVKFDFNPELTKINVETTESSTASSTTAVSTTTTKRPRNNSKRKKNKSRRRKPSTTTPTTTLSTTVSTESNELSTEIALDNAIQESKIEPESKIASNKTKKKAPPKAISTQIYNFLSREVMPSFGVMSLVGLGLGLASYFLYPFGSTITRRNYEVEPNYKYNMDEYGGNYGQNEEEVLSKVLQGMTNHESKYPQKGFEDYYRYQHYEGAYDTQTRKTERHPPSSSPVYRPSENTATILKYRNTEFRYPEVQTTPNYYERQKQSEFVVGQELPGNRQFVVGNIPKEYSYNEKIPALTTKKPTGVYESKENNQQNQYDRDVPQNFHFPPNPVQTYGHPEPQTTRSDEGYEEIEITPTAVAVEHGPRSLKVKRSILDDPAKKESVIQVIPSKRELEEAEKQSDLSNEILDIIDSALPGGDDSGKDEENEVEDVDAQKKKREEEEKTRLKESTMKTLTTENTEKPMSTENVTSSTVVSTEETSSTSTPFTESSSKLSTREPDESIEWTETTTKNPKRDENFNIFSFVKKVAEIKFRLGLTILKHASEGFARYLGNVQKRLNGEE